MSARRTGLIHPLPDGLTYQFSIGPKVTLPAEIVAVALLHFLGQLEGNRRTVSVQECLYRPLSPGQIFKLDQTSLLDYLEAIEALTGGDLALDETAGLQQVYVRRNVDWRELLQQYFAEAPRRYIPPSFLVAHRHSYETGAVRFFEVLYPEEPPRTRLPLPRTGNGLLAYCLASGPTQVEQFRKWAMADESAVRADLIVAIPEQLGPVQDVASELVALNRVWEYDNAASPQSARAIHGELSRHVVKGATNFSPLWGRLLDPRPHPTGTECAWY